MADTVDTKAEAAAEKAYAAAAAEAPVAPKAEAPVEAPATAPVAKKAPAKKAPAKKPVATAKKTPAKRAAAKKAPARKPAAKTTTKKPTPKKAPVAAKTNSSADLSVTQLKEKIMATAKKTDYVETAKNAAAKVQEQLKSAYEKSSEYASEAVEFSKGNVEAVVESGKILAAGLQDMGKEMVEETKTAYATAQDDMKKVTAVKSPTEFFQLQGELARRNFDAMVSTTSKNTEAMMKLANDAFAPISSRVSLAVEKVSKAA